jgi:hypothetical protein
MVNDACKGAALGRTGAVGHTHGGGNDDASCRRAMAAVMLSRALDEAADAAAVQAH